MRKLEALEELVNILKYSFLERIESDENTASVISRLTIVMLSLYSVRHTDYLYMRINLKINLRFFLQGKAVKRENIISVDREK